MATQSFFKRVNIKTQEQAGRFVNALEKAEKFAKEEKVSSTRAAYEVKGEDVNSFMKKIRWSD